MTTVQPQGVETPAPEECSTCAHRDSCPRHGGNAPAATPACPPWCTSTAADHVPQDVDTLDGSKYHPGPHFGAVELAGVTRADGSVRSFSWCCDTNGDATPANLRALAADAIAAAEWLEANQ